MKILLAGATGFIGQPLVEELLRQGHDLVLLTRNPAAVIARPSLTLLPWDGRSTDLWSHPSEGIEAIINLAGAGIADERWSPERKKLLISSRVQSTKALVDFIRQSKKKPAVFINASAIGYYGNVPEGTVSEETPRGSGFLADVCDLWEQEALKAQELGVRVALPRIGIVLEHGGGALSKMIFPFKMYAGGPLGSGRQWFSWIHRDDIIGALTFILERPLLSGPVNLTAPNPLTMKDFCSSLGKAMHRPSWAPVPGFILKLLLGEMSEMLLGGQKVIPKKLLDAGYQFKYSEASAALQSILKK